MKINKTKIIVASLAVMASTFAVTSLVSANQGRFDGERPERNPERHEAMEKVMESGDYEAWVELVGDKGNKSEVITQDNFSTFQEMWQLKQDGNYEEAQVLAQELGLPAHKGMHQGFGRGGMGPRQMIDQNGDGLCDLAEQEPTTE